MKTNTTQAAKITKVLTNRQNPLSYRQLSARLGLPEPSVRRVMNEQLSSLKSKIVLRGRTTVAPKTSSKRVASHSRKTK